LPETADAKRNSHYLKRYQLHLESQAAETDLRTAISQLQMLQKTERKSHLCVYVRALDALCQARHILKNSYVFAFFVFNPTTEEHTGGEDESEVATTMQPTAGVARHRNPLLIPFAWAAGQIFRTTTTTATASNNNSNLADVHHTASNKLPSICEEQKKWQGIFEHHQQELEMNIEQLSSILGNPIAKILSDSNNVQIAMDQSNIVIGRLKALYDLVQTELLGADSGLVSSMHPFDGNQNSPYHLNTKQLVELLRKT
jgi:hypothetical protein